MWQRARDAARPPTVGMMVRHCSSAVERERREARPLVLRRWKACFDRADNKPHFEPDAGVPFHHQTLDSISSFRQMVFQMFRCSTSDAIIFGPLSTVLKT